jgi:hypothetical protein
MSRSEIISIIAHILEPWAFETTSWNATVARDDAMAKAEQIADALATTPGGETLSQRQAREVRNPTSGYAVQSGSPAQSYGAAITPGGDLLEQAITIVNEEGPQNPESDWTDYARARASMRDNILKRLRALKPAGDGGEA